MTRNSIQISDGLFSGNHLCDRKCVQMALLQHACHAGKSLNQNGGAYYLTIKHVTYYTVPKLRAATRPLHVSAQCNNLHHHAGSCTCLKLLVSHRNTRQAMNAQCQHARCAGQRAQSHAAIERCKLEDLSRAFAQALAASGLVVSGRASVPGMAEVWRT
ncbi:hypothetical protein Fuma_02491 [Fuerstiella marisgermanici]|uniref:Uncharacterized protein n=1 Tax=Fuerstiella marisgermanici TaxID=1891926 RepID=A0A1P8WFN0_9PLAN|nr:hypothetical protein Fuma_02491 [Fuerstiella marisgermanici]